MEAVTVEAAARGVLQLHLGVLFWFQYEGDVNDAWERGEGGLGGAEVDDRRWVMLESGMDEQMSKGDTKDTITSEKR